MKKNLINYLNVHSPGYVIEIYINGKNEEIVIGNKAVLPKKEKTNSNTLYDIASLTKVYTATLIYMAFEEGMLKLEDSVYKLDHRFTKLKKVAILDLLSHNQNIWTNGYLGNSKSKEEFYKILFSAYVKETIPTYVDVHYMILSTILEKIYGKPYQELCEEKILKKLNLRHTTFHPDEKNVASNNYDYSGETVVDTIYPGQIHDTKARVAKNLGIYLGHASLFATGSDLLKFLLSFFDYSLLSKETVAFMLQHRKTNEQNLKKLKTISRKMDIDEMYEQFLSGTYEFKILKTYNNMGIRYRNCISKLNDVPNKASGNSVSFCGFTGPMFTIDFDQKIIIVIMCNTIHNVKLNRIERKNKTVEIMNQIFDSL